MTETIAKYRIVGGRHFKMYISEEIMLGLLGNEDKVHYIQAAIKRMRLQIAYYLHHATWEFEIKAYYERLDQAVHWYWDLKEPPPAPLDWSKRPIPDAFTFARPAKNGELELEMVFGGQVVEVDCG
jgi:hypothetical protein